MDRRKFLKLAGLASVWPLSAKFGPWPDINSLAINRLEKWRPNSSLRVEWRYAAGRIIDGGQDFGFIISMSDIKISGVESQQFSVQRQNFTGNQEFVGKTYTGSLIYDSGSAYTFKDEAAQILATWQWDDDAAQPVYKLTVNTPELSLDNLVLRPKGALIPEGGTGSILVGQIAGILIDSDYHADWTGIEISGQEKGVARVDMQGLRPPQPLSNLATVFGGWLEQSADKGQPPLSSARIKAADSTEDYDHHWFAAAVELSDGPAWVSAWRIEDAQGPFWGLTIARYGGTSWQVVLSLTEKDTVIVPLEVNVLAWQELPASAASQQSTGTAWRLTAGVNQANDALDIQISVPPGQFITNTKQILGSWLEEGVGLEVMGTILGNPVSSTKMVAAETTAEFSLNFLPIVLDQN
jgi:hypothetical protein